MEKYYTQSVTVVIRKESELFRRIENISDQTGRSVESVFESLATAGIYHLMLGNAMVAQRTIQGLRKEEP